MKKSASTLTLILAAAVLGGCASTQAAKEEMKEQQQAAQVNPAPAPAPAPAVAKTVANDTYDVSRGDCLWNISAKNTIYGNPYEWPLIYAYNRDKIKDADLIYPGQVFTIDRAMSMRDIDAAVKHAKTRGAWKLGVVPKSDIAYLAKYGNDLKVAASRSQ